MSLNQNDISWAKRPLCPSFSRKFRAATESLRVKSEIALAHALYSFAVIFFFLHSFEKFEPDGNLSIGKFGGIVVKETSLDACVLQWNAWFQVSALLWSLASYCWTHHGGSCQGQEAGGRLEASLPSSWKTWTKFCAPGFGLDQAWLWEAFGKWIRDAKIILLVVPLSLVILPCKLEKQTNRTKPY